MTDFYVYRLNANEDNDEHQLAFVDSPEKFSTVFDPACMEFSGIKIVADNVENAQHVYHNPTSELGDYILCDEPSETQRLYAIDFIREKFDRFSLLLMVRKLGLMNSSINQLLSEISRKVYARSNKLMTPEDIYKMLKEKWCKQMVEEAEYVDGESGKA